MGYGEVGRALAHVLERIYEVSSWDKKYEAMGGTMPDWSGRVLHICFPYSETFVEDVRNLADKLHPWIVVVHSSVPVGTCRKLGAVHSPIRGLHPNLEEGIRTFVKFLGGERAWEIADYFRRAGLKVQLCDKSETTELMKLLDTEYYRVCIQFCQMAKSLTEKYSVPFAEAYSLANLTYNEGYEALGHPEFIRPVLQPILGHSGQIGGHCVEPNHALLINPLDKLENLT